MSNDPTRATGDLEVRIVALPALRVASVRVVSDTPEPDAWARLRPWAERSGLLEDPDAYPVFGFNAPGPAPEGGPYGYELWIAIGPEMRPDAGIDVQDFPGGRYAATTCRLRGDPRGSVPDVWMRLWAWVKESREHTWRRSQELERHLDPRADEERMVLELLLPIV